MDIVSHIIEAYLLLAMKITVRRSEYELLLKQYYTRKCTLRTTSSTCSLHLPKAFAMYSDPSGSLIDL